MRRLLMEGQKRNTKRSIGTKPGNSVPTSRRYLRTHDGTVLDCCSIPKTAWDGSPSPPGQDRSCPLRRKTRRSLYQEDVPFTGKPRRSLYREAYSRFLFAASMEEGNQPIKDQSANGNPFVPTPILMTKTISPWKTTLYLPCRRVWQWKQNVFVCGLVRECV